MDQQREEALSLIIQGCKLAKKLELDLPTLADQPNFLFFSCEEISRTFTRAMNLLNVNPSSFFNPLIFSGPSESSSRGQQIDTSGHKQTIDLLYPYASPFDIQLLPESRTGSKQKLELALELEIPMPSSSTALELPTERGHVSTREADAAAPATLRAGGEIQASDTSDSGRSSKGEHRSKKRKSSGEVRIQRIPAPLTGNLEIPPDDGFTWRKYGQKEILNSKFPRSYYRCTYKNYGCSAKKQVQRLDNDSYTFEVTYRGDHTCQTSQTPLLLPSSGPKQEMPESTEPSSLPTSVSLGSLTSREFEPSHRDKNVITDPQMIMHPAPLVGGGRSSSRVESSHVQGGKEVAECTVAEFADAIFNSGSSSNSMDAIFSSKKQN